MTALDRVFDALTQHGCGPPRGHDWRCPAHDDRTPSLGVNESGDGKVLLHCGAGCSINEVVAALDLRIQDLRGDAIARTNGAARSSKTTKPPPEILESRPCTSAQAHRMKRDRRITEAETLERVGAQCITVRFFRDDGTLYPDQEWLGIQNLGGGRKLFAYDRNGNPRQTDGKLWRRNIGPASILASPDLAEATRVRRLYDLEGESDWLAFIDAGGVAAITNTTGAASLKGHERHRDALLAPQPEEVCVIRDLDETGRKGAEKAAAWWLAQGVAVRAVTLPQELGEKGDVRDFLAAGHGVAELDSLCDTAPLHEPEIGTSARVDPGGVARPHIPHIQDDERSVSPTTELANAQRLVEHCGDDLRWFEGLGWMAWCETHWRRSESRAINICARLSRVIQAEAAELERQAAQAGDSKRREQLAKAAEDRRRWAKASESETCLRHTLLLARAYLELPIDALDEDIFAFNCPNGTLDLRSGKLRPHRRSDFITKLSGVAFDAEAKAPRWRKFLEEILPDPDVRAFVQRLAGYALSGSTQDHVLPILRGGGGNGKTVLRERWLKIWGDYGDTTPSKTLLATRDAIPNDIAALRGLRLAVASETDDGRRLAEAKVKELTGGDRVKARFLHQEFFTFQPQVKVILSTNHRPQVRGTDQGIWRRLRLISFTQTFDEEGILGPKPDPTLPEKLDKELPGILNWALEGHRAWQREGLGTPDAVREATAEYRTAEDIVGEWLSEFRQDRRASGFTPIETLYESYKAWCEKGGEKPEGKRKLGNLLEERGLKRDRILFEGKSRRGVVLP